MLEKNSPTGQDQSLKCTAIPAREGYRNPAVDIVEGDAGLILRADLPGLEQDQLQVGIDQGLLTIEGGTTGQAEGDGLYEEFAVAGYYRQFRLPETIDTDKVKAELKHGVLTLHLPKAEAEQPKKIPVETIH